MEVEEDEEEGVDIDFVEKVNQQCANTSGMASHNENQDHKLMSEKSVREGQKEQSKVDKMIIDSDEDGEEMDENAEPVDDPNDPIVRRYEVFLTNNLANNLFLFQYLLRPKDRPYDFNQLTEVRFKKEHKKMEMEFELNTHNEHYDQENPQTMKSFVLSSRIVPSRTNYAVGVTRGNHLHITPLQHILQFKTSLEHLDEKFIGAGEKVISREEKEKKASATKNQAQIVQATYRTQADERARQKTYEYMKQQEQAEKPINMEFFPSDHPTARQVFERLFATSDHPVAFDMSPAAYLETLVPYKHDPLARLKGEQISLDLLRKMPGPRQVQLALFAANILHFGRIKQLATNVKNEETLINLIEDNAVLVRGCWILKSHLKQLNPSVLNQKFTITVETVARDYLLYLFHKQPYIDRIAFQEKTGLDNELVQTMLEEIAVVSYEKQDNRRHGYWVLKLPPDEEFIKNYPSVVQRQEENWETRTPQILSYIESGFKNIQQTILNVPSSTNRTQDMNKLLVSIIMDQFQRYGVCSHSMLLAAFKESKTKNELLKNISAEQFNTIASQMTRTFCDKDHLILKHTPELPESERLFRNAIIDVLEENKHVKLTRQQISEAAKKKLPPDAKVNVSMNVIMKILTEVATDTADNHYIPRTPSDKPSNK